MVTFLQEKSLVKQCFRNNAFQLSQILTVSFQSRMKLCENPSVQQFTSSLAKRKLEFFPLLIFTTYQCFVWDFLDFWELNVFNEVTDQDVNGPYLSLPKTSKYLPEASLVNIS